MCCKYSYYFYSYISKIVFNYWKINLLLKKSTIYFKEFMYFCSEYLCIINILF